MNTLAVSVIIPSYNEETNIRLGALDKVARFLEQKSYTWEVIIVDDGSTDASPNLLDMFAKHNKGFRVIHNHHQGKAATVLTGMMMARGDIVLFTDLDQATPIEEIDKLLPWFEKKYDVVIGSRNSQREGAPLLRRVMARGFMFLRTVVLGLSGIKDTQCGFKAFRQSVVRELASKLKLYEHGKNVHGSMVTAGFDIELLYVAKALGYGIKEVPVQWHYVDTRRVSPFKDSWQGLVDIVRIRSNAQKGLYR